MSTVLFWSWRSAAGIVTSLWAGQSAVSILAGVGDFCPLQNVQTGPRAYTASSSLVNRGCFSKGKGVDQSPLSSAEVKNEWNCISAPSHAFMHGQEQCNQLCFMERVYYVS